MIRLVFFSLLIFLGLYFFGDFDVNGTNVKGYLQQKVTQESLIKLKDATVSLYETLSGWYKQQNFSKEEAPQQTDETTKPNQPPAVKKVVPQQHISPEAQKKFEQMLKEQK